MHDRQTKHLCRSAICKRRRLFCAVLYSLWHTPEKWEQKYLEALQHRASKIEVNRYCVTIGNYEVHIPRWWRGRFVRAIRRAVVMNVDCGLHL